jgi:hypothetical protein
MNPYIICHMLSSVNGKIDGNALDVVIAEGEYDATGSKLEGDAWICGRTTMQQHFAEDELFVSASNTPAGPQPVFVARRADSYAISVETLGKLRWSSGDLDGDHLVCVVSERVPADYLTMLRENGISYVVAGETCLRRIVSLTFSRIPQSPIPPRLKAEWAMAREAPIRRTRAAPFTSISGLPVCCAHQCQCRRYCCECSFHHRTR